MTIEDGLTARDEALAAPLTSEDIDMFNAILGDDTDGSELLPDAAAASGYDTRIFMIAHKLDRALEDVRDRRDALHVAIEDQRAKLLAPLDHQAEQIEQQLKDVQDRIQSLLLVREQEGLGRSLSIPGIGKAALRKVPGSWRVEDKKAVWAWLKERELHTRYAAAPTLSTPALKKDLENLIKAEGGEIPDGVVHTDEHDSFSWKRLDH